MRVLLVLVLTNCVVAFAPSRTPTTPFFTTTRLSPPPPHKAAILPTDPCTSTTLFASSPDKKYPNLSIEYCTGCRWMFRASWLMQECLTTFNDEMGSITLIPSKPPSPGGTFLIKINNDIIWDRKLEGAFPEAKQLKQRIRDKISPQKDLGHSDIVKNDVLTDSSSISSSSKSELDGHCQECEDAEKSALLSTTENENIISDKEGVSSTESSASLPNINITYCTGCKWMMRATWMCQELLSTFQEELHSITITPSRPPQEGGQYIIFANDNKVWDRSEMKGFPEAKELKRLVRDTIAPEKSLGHADIQDVNDEGSDVLLDDDDDAAEMRSFYGVL